MALNFIIPDGAAEAYTLARLSNRSEQLAMQVLPGGLEICVDLGKIYGTISTNIRATHQEDRPGSYTGSTVKKYVFGTQEADNFSRDGPRIFNPLLEAILADRDRFSYRLHSNDIGRSQIYEQQIDGATIEINCDLKSTQSFRVDLNGDFTTAEQTQRMMLEYFRTVSEVLQGVYSQAGVNLGEITIPLRLIRADKNRFRAEKDIVNLSSLDAATKFRDENASFEQIIGHGPVKTYLLNMARALKEGSYKAWGIAPPSGIILYGPPGNGKTSLARALSNEAGFVFRHVDIPTILSTYQGKTAQNIEALFDLRASGTTIYFLDEIDSLVRGRANAQSNGSVEVLGTLLEKMDGIRKGGAPVIFLASTNALDLVDDAFLRPGRFTYHLEIPNPNAEDRRQLLIHYAQRHRTRNAPVTFADELRVDRVVDIAEGESSAFMEEIVRAAVESSMFDSFNGEARPLTDEDLLTAAETVRNMRYQQRKGKKVGFSTASI
ncbi:ATP-binding protein [Candidatus Woesearchaeota archaeon]|nr:ATP-binding protein [Candidatus Woesearchaeota archaeon]